MGRVDGVCVAARTCVDRVRTASRLEARSALDAPPRARRRCRAAIAAAIEGCGPRAAKAAKACATEKSYRFGYARHVKELVRQGAYSPQAAVGSSQKGLDYMYANFEYVDKDGVSTPFGAAMKGSATVTGRSLKSVKVQGSGTSAATCEAVWKSTSEPPRHRADAVTGATSRRWRGAPEI